MQNRSLKIWMVWEELRHGIVFVGIMRHGIVVRHQPFKLNRTNRWFWFSVSNRLTIIVNRFGGIFKLISVFRFHDSVHQNRSVFQIREILYKNKKQKPTSITSSFLLFSNISSSRNPFFSVLQPLFIFDFLILLPSSFPCSFFFSTILFRRYLLSSRRYIDPLRRPLQQQRFHAWFSTSLPATALHIFSTSSLFSQFFFFISPLFFFTSLCSVFSPSNIFGLWKT